MVAEEPATLTEMEPSDAWAGYAEHELFEAATRCSEQGITDQRIVEIIFEAIQKKRLSDAA